MTNLDVVISQANDSAAAMADTVDGTTNQFPAAPAASYAAVPMSMDDAVESTGLIPGSVPYLKVNEFGLRIGNAKKFIPDFEAVIDMTAGEGFVTKTTMRYGQNPAKYVSTYDGAISDKGTPWPVEMQRAKAISPDLDPYMSADILMTLPKGVKGEDSKIDPDGQLAFVPSKSNFSNWRDFYSASKKAGLIGKKVKAKISFEDITHNGNTWGVVTFELLGEVK